RRSSDLIGRPSIAELFPYTTLFRSAHKRRALELVTAYGRRRIGVVGLSFKTGTDDLRESPTVELVEQLLGRGYEVRVFDPDVARSEEHTSELQSRENVVCRLLLETK